MNLIMCNIHFSICTREDITGFNSNIDLHSENERFTIWNYNIVKISGNILIVFDQKNVSRVYFLFNSHNHLPGTRKYIHHISYRLEQ